MELNRRKTIKKRKPTNMVVNEKTVAAALKKAGGVQTHAAEMLGISQSAVSQRVTRSEYLREVYNDIRNEMLDLAETVLFKKIKAENLTAVIFFLKCLGKERGYSEKQELEVSQKKGNGVLVVPGVSGSVEEWQDSIKDYKKKNEEKKNEKSIH